MPIKSAIVDMKEQNKESVDSYTVVVVMGGFFFFFEESGGAAAPTANLLNRNQIQLETEKQRQKKTEKQATEEKKRN